MVVVTASVRGLVLRGGLGGRCYRVDSGGLPTAVWARTTAPLFGCATVSTKAAAPPVMLKHSSTVPPHRPGRRIGHTWHSRPSGRIQGPWISLADCAPPPESRAVVTRPWLNLGCKLTPGHRSWYPHWVGSLHGRTAENQASRAATLSKDALVTRTADCASRALDPLGEYSNPDKLPEKR